MCYRLWIRAIASEMNRRETLIIPIVIGTIPLKKEEEEKSETKLKLKLPIFNNEDGSIACQCTCPCPHCARSKIITNASGSPENFDNSMVPQTPMSPLDKIDFTRVLATSNGIKDDGFDYEVNTTETSTLTNENRAVEVN